MQSLNAIIQIVLVVTLAVAAASDIRTQRIPNRLTFPAILLGLALNGLHAGWGGLLFSLEGLGVASITLLLFVLMGGMGAGDVKLLWAVGALMGPTFALWTLLCTALIGGVMGVAWAAKKGALLHTVRNAAIGGHVLSVTHSNEVLKGMSAVSKAGKMPYAPAIMLGAAAAAILLARGIV